MGRISRLGLFALAFALIGIVVWVPTDIGTGYVEKVRRSMTLGDSLAPTVAFSIIGLGGLMLIVEQISPKRKGRSSNHDLSASDNNHTGFALKLLLLFVIYSLILRYSGPLLTMLWPNLDAPYRLLRDTAPWKYIGFILSGVFLMTSLATWSSQVFRWRVVSISLLVCMLIIALYDWPFDDLLLPPNGDV